MNCNIFHPFVSATLVFFATGIFSLVGDDSALPVIHLAGDSTMAAKQEDKRPETGWGEKIGAFFKDGILVQNDALNGRSALSFRTEGLWDKLIDRIRPGDYVLIQFGHNDQKTNMPQHYSPPAVFKKRLIEFVGEVRGRHGNPILVTSVTRRSFESDGTLRDTLSDYTEQTRAAAAETGVPLIDLSERSREKLGKLGVEESKKWYLHFLPGEQSNYPQGIADDTHFCDKGAAMVAALVAEEIARVDAEGLGRYLKKQ